MIITFDTKLFIGALAKSGMGSLGPYVISGGVWFQIKNYPAMQFRNAPAQITPARNVWSVTASIPSKHQSRDRLAPDKPLAMSHAQI